MGLPQMLISYIPTKGVHSVRLDAIEFEGGSPGLVVTGGDSCSEGHGFASWRHILDGHDIFLLDLL